MFNLKSNVINSVYLLRNVHRCDNNCYSSLFILFITLASLLSSFHHRQSLLLLSYSLNSLPFAFLNMAFFLLARLLAVFASSFAIIFLLLFSNSSFSLSISPACSIASILSISCRLFFLYAWNWPESAAATEPGFCWMPWWWERRSQSTAVSGWRDFGCGL